MFLLMSLLFSTSVLASPLDLAALIGEYKRVDSQCTSRTIGIVIQITPDDSDPSYLDWTEIYEKPADSETWVSTSAIKPWLTRSPQEGTVRQTGASCWSSEPETEITTKTTSSSLETVADIWDDCNHWWEPDLIYLGRKSYRLERTASGIKIQSVGTKNFKKSDTYSCAYIKTK